MDAYSYSLTVPVFKKVSLLRCLKFPVSFSRELRAKALRNLGLVEVPQPDEAAISLFISLLSDSPSQRPYGAQPLTSRHFVGGSFPG